MAHHELQAAENLIKEKSDRHAKEVEERKTGTALIGVVLDWTRANVLVLRTWQDSSVCKAVHL